MIAVHFCGTFLLTYSFLFWFWFVVGAAGSISLSFARLGQDLAPPEVTQGASESPNVPIHIIKPMILQGRLSATIGLQGSPLGPPLSPQGPPRGPPRAPKGP